MTDSAGTIRIDDLTPGMTVIAREVRAKDGYILDDTPQSIKIKRNAVMTLEFRNQPKGGVFCNLPDGVTCMCNYSYQHEDADFMVGEHVMLMVQRYDQEKLQMYGKIMSKW